MLKITIVTVTFNNCDTIEKTVTSVLDQNYLNLEYIVIDGGSTDGTLEILDKYKNKFKYFKSSTDKGIYDAMNKGIAEATGDLVGFVNGDDYLYEDVLNHVSDCFIEAKTKLLFSVGDIDYVDHNDNIVGSKICRSTKQILKRRYIEMPTNHLSMFVPIEAFKDNGFFDLRFSNRADYFFILKLIKNGYRPLHLRKKIGCFRLGGQSGSYSTFLENYKIIRIISGSIFISLYSTILSILKLFFRRNLPSIYNFIIKKYYEYNKDLKKREILSNENSKIIHVIDSDQGGGAEKLVSFLKNLKITERVVILSKSNENINLNSKYFSLNIKTKSAFGVLLASWRLFWFLLKIKNRKKIILHSHLGKSLYSTFLPATLLRIKHIHTEHNTHNRRRSKWYMYFFEYSIYSSLLKIICISKATKESLTSYLPKVTNKVSIIENGTNILKHQKRNFKKKLDILILGSLTYKKGIDLFIEIIPYFLDRINSLKIIGSGSEKKKLVQLTKKLSLENKIKFIPFIEDPTSHIYSSEIGIVPSRWEGFGLVAIEMRSSGMPIVISDTPGLYNIFSSYDGVYAFKNESKESLKDSFTLLLDELSAEQFNIKDLSTEFEVYSKNSFLQRYENFYKNLNIFC